MEQTFSSETEADRQDIFDLDQRIVELLNQRALVQQRLLESVSNGKEPVLDEMRAEASVLENAIAANHTCGRVLGDDDIVVLFRDILGLSRMRHKHRHLMLQIMEVMDAMNH